MLDESSVYQGCAVAECGLQRGGEAYRPIDTGWTGGRAGMRERRKGRCDVTPFLSNCLRVFLLNVEVDHLDHSDEATEFRKPCRWSNWSMQSRRPLILWARIKRISSDAWSILRTTSIRGNTSFPRLSWRRCSSLMPVTPNHSVKHWTSF